MYLKLRLKGEDLPADHHAAPWAHGEDREVDLGTAIALMRERTEDFELAEVEKIPLGILPLLGINLDITVEAPAKAPEPARVLAQTDIVDAAHRAKEKESEHETAVGESAQPRSKRGRS